MGKLDFPGYWCFTDNLDKPLDFKDVKIGEWVIVIYKGKKFLGKVLDKKNGEIKVRWLEKSWDCRGTRFWTIRGCYILYWGV